MATYGTPQDPGADTLQRASGGDKPQLKLGRYEVVRELGKGAMGIVYLAKDPLIGRLVALKTIRAAAHADDDETKEFQQRFIREAQAAGILNHPSIVTVHDIGQDDGLNTSFIAMEYVEGQNLKEVLSQGRALTFEQIGDIIIQVADALDFAHAKGIVHRDVKPANIILLDGLRAKITDFGIAKIASGGANLTSTGQFLGTPNYMAPEQIKGAPVDGRTDIFALGICLYECLTRRKPFGGDSLTSISYKIVHESFPPLAEVNPQIPEGYEEVVAHCLAKDPAKRYQRARDMGNALRAVVRGEKPARPSEPLLADETIVTHSRGADYIDRDRLDRDRLEHGDRDRTPTLEVPFPEAVEASAVGEPVHEVGGSTRPAAKAAAAVAAANAKPRAPRPPRPPREPLGNQVRRTLTNVRSAPMWRQKVAPPLFIGIIAVLVAGVLSVVVAARVTSAKEPPVNRAAEAQRAQERRLRHEGNQLLRQGKVTDAYPKFMELRRLAPRSPWVAGQIAKLDLIRQAEASSKQQLVVAQTKFQEGLALYNQKKFAESIPLFQEAFTLNPSFGDAATYLQQAQLEDQKIQAAKARRTNTPGGRNAATSTTTAATQTTATVAPVPEPVNDTPAQFYVNFTHPFTEGQIIVKLGADTILRADLSQEVRRGLLRRRGPKPVSSTQQVTPKSADLQIWVLVPGQKITQYHVMPARIQPGASHRLTIRFNESSKTFSYELN